MEDGELNRKNLEIDEAQDEDIGWLTDCKKTGVQQTWEEVVSRHSEGTAYWRASESLQ